MEKVQVVVGHPTIRSTIFVNKRIHGGSLTNGIMAAFKLPFKWSLFSTDPSSGTTEEVASVPIIEENVADQVIYRINGIISLYPSGDLLPIFLHRRDSTETSMVLVEPKGGQFADEMNALGLMEPIATIYQGTTEMMTSDAIFALSSQQLLEILSQKFGLMLCVSYASKKNAEALQAAPTNPLQAARYNQASNSQKFLDPNHVLPALRQWIDACWLSAMDRKTHSPSFCICQSSGTGKTKLVQQLAKKSPSQSESGTKKKKVDWHDWIGVKRNALMERHNDPCWLFLLMCRDSQNMSPCPILAILQELLLSELKRFNTSQTITLSMIESKLATKDKLSYMDFTMINHLIECVSVRMLTIFKQMIKFVVKNHLDEEQLADLLKYDEDVFGRVNATWQEILDLNIRGDSLSQLVRQLPNKRFVVCFDHAMGLFIDNQSSLVFRGVRRASIEILSTLKDFEDSLCVFIFIDTNTTIAEVINLPYPEWSSDWREKIIELDRPQFPLFPFLATHNVHALKALSEQLVAKGAVLSHRRMADMNEDAKLQLARLGRPAWKALYKSFLQDRFDLLVKQIGERLTDSIEGDYKMHHLATQRQRPDAMTFNRPHLLCLLAFRMPFRIARNCGLASYMADKALGVLVHSDQTSKYVVFPAEPVLAAAASKVMQVYSEQLIEMIKSEIQFFAIEAEWRGEMIVMLQAMAAMDSLTRYQPYHAVSLHEWFRTWLGLEGNPLPLWSQSALLTCGQFSAFDLLDQLHWSYVEQARFQGVGMVPESPRQPGFDMIIPFEQKDGSCGALVIKVGNSVSAKSDILDQCRVLKKTAPQNTMIVPLLIEPGDCVYVCLEIDSGVFSDPLPIKFTAENTWDHVDSFLTILEGLDSNTIMLESLYDFEEVQLSDLDSDEEDSD